MNVLLVSPSQGRTFESVGIRIPPLGLFYIAGALRQSGHDVRLDISEGTEDQRNIDFSNVNIVGITSTTSQFNAALRIAEQAHQAGKTVIMGGSHATSTTEETLNSGYVDYIVRGEGEITVVELLKAIEESNGRFDPSKVRGISYYDQESGRVVNNKPRAFIDDLDTLPLPARDLGGDVLHHRYKNIDGLVAPSIITTRGCPYRCRFCDAHLLAGRKWRMRSTKSVVDEIEYLVTDYGAQEIRIVDDIINHDNEVLHQLMNAIIARGFNIKIWVMGRADMIIRDPSTAEKMARAGVKTFFAGIESPNKRILKTYKKGGNISADTSRQAVNLLRQYDIETFGGFMIGEPSETKEEVEATIDYACSLNPATAQFTIMTPYPGTEIWQDLKDQLIVHDWDKFDGLHAVFNGIHLSAAEMESLCQKAYMKFYLRSKRIINQISSAIGLKESTGPRLKTMISLLKENIH